MDTDRIAIIGGGNLGSALANGLTASGRRPRSAVTITRRTEQALEPLRREGFQTTTDNRAAIRGASVVIVAVRPAQLGSVLDEIAEALDSATQVVVSTVTNVSIAAMTARLPEQTEVLRAMPNIGVAVGESMTCLACATKTPQTTRDRIAKLFNELGLAQFIEEEQMTPATSLCACGIAFFLRAIRAASQGGVQVGFHADEAIRLAAQTAKGAAELILELGEHPESLVDSVTTPLGVTIAGLNEMEHQGFSSAMIRGIVVSAEKALRLSGDAPTA